MNDYIETIKNQLIESALIKEKITQDAELLNNIYKCAKIISDAYINGNKLLIAGNGGSAADAIHIAGEFVSRFNFDRAPLSAIALNTNVSILTAISNDYSYDDIFSRQVNAFGRQGDVFIGITTSGASKNIIEAVHAANILKVKTITFTGGKPSLLDELCTISIKVPSDKTPRIQESHITIGHIICEQVESTIFGDKRK